MTSRTDIPGLPVLVDDAMLFTLDELARACDATGAQLVVLVEEGVLAPIGHTPDDWRFPGSLLARARTALRLARDLELGAAAIALVLDLIDENERLRARLRRAGAR